MGSLFLLILLLYEIHFTSGDYQASYFRGIHSRVYLFIYSLIISEPHQ